MKKSQKQSEQHNPAAMLTLMDGFLRAKLGKPVDESQDLAYQAMESESFDEHIGLLKDALTLDAGNVDALLMLVSAAEFKGEERIRILRAVVEVGARRLGKNAFKELAPHFWGHVETRPYMRARMQLSEALRAEGKIEETIKEYQDILHLNEIDNLGVRYLLLPGLMTLNRLEEAQALLKQYEDESEWSVVFSWCQVLERLLSKDDAGATKALTAARKQNPHMEKYLKGHSKIPKELPGSYSPGSNDEAITYAEPLVVAWNKFPDAMAWLHMQNDRASLRIVK